MTSVAKKVLISCTLLTVLVIALVTGEHKTMGDPTALHEWIGLLVLAGVAAHAVLYWKILKGWLVRYFQVGRKQKVVLVLDLAILVMVVLTVLSGIIISQQLGLGNMESHWRIFHHIAPKLILLLVLAHVILSFGKIKLLFKK